MMGERDTAPERRPGSPSRDHTIHPTGQVDPDESGLPEGPQPTKKVERRTWMLAGVLLVVFVIATVIAYVVGDRTNRLAPALIAAAIAGGIGAVPVLIAWYFRRKDKERLNK